MMNKGKRKHHRASNWWGSRQTYDNNRGMRELPARGCILCYVRSSARPGPPSTCLLGEFLNNSTVRTAMCAAHGQPKTRGPAFFSKQHSSINWVRGTIPPSVRRYGRLWFHIPSPQRPLKICTHTHTPPPLRGRWSLWTARDQKPTSVNNKSKQKVQQRTDGAVCSDGKGSRVKVEEQLLPGNCATRGVGSLDDSHQNQREAMFKSGQQWKRLWSQHDNALFLHNIKTKHYNQLVWTIE